MRVRLAALALLVTSIAPSQTLHAASARSAPAPTAYETCFQRAGTYYQINPLLLRAIARHESGMNPMATNVNTDGSEDVGLMQVNLKFNPALRQHGFRREHLFDPCTNVALGAYILAGFVRRYGMTWYAVGKYNARDDAKGRRYAGLILKRVMAEVTASGVTLPGGTR